MQLSQYPSMIEAAARVVAELDARITHLKMQAAEYELEADLNIAFDSELKNDNQRKARRAEILVKNEQYGKGQKALIETVQQKAFAQANLESLRNELEILKLATPELPQPADTKGCYLALTINPDAKYDWERFQLRDSLTRSTQDFPELIAAAVGGKPGNYLVSLGLSVTVLQTLDLEGCQVNG